MDTNQIGKNIGTYHVIERLGAGGMASVYRAYDAVRDRYVAVKVLPVHLAANDTLRQRFMREAQMAARLQHPHILPIYDFGEDHEAPYIVMKLVDGGTLESFVREGPLPLMLIARTTAHIAGALDYAHQHGIIHRDLKPQNILFDAKGNAYLADFGVARLYEGAEHLTGTGGFVGTAAYASPEQCRGEELTPVSDIYSLGVVLYEMLTGYLPFDGATALAIMHQHISEAVPNPLKHRPELPIEITEVLRKALAKLPAVRYQSAGALSAALLESLRRELGTQPFVANAPPIGPNPVFDTTNAPPPPMPDELLRDLSASKPSPPPALRRATPPNATPAATSATLPTKKPAMTGKKSSGGRTSFYVFLIVVATLLTLAVIVQFATGQ